MTIEREVVFDDEGKPKIDANGRVEIHHTWTASHAGHVDGDGCGFMLTGPARGAVHLSDGTRYDVTPDVIEHGPGHRDELCELIVEKCREQGTLPQ